METSRSPKLRSWIGLGILLVALGGLLLLGKALDRLPNARVVPGLATLRGSQRRVVESLSVVPSELGGPGRDVEEMRRINTGWTAEATHGDDGA